VREHFVEVATAHHDRVQSALRRCGAAQLELSTDRDWVSDIARFALTYRRSAASLHPSAPVDVA